MTFRALVTGGNGFVGRHLVGELLARGADVTCVGRDAEPPPPATVRSITGDLCDAAFVATLPRSWDTVFHLAARSVPSAFGGADDVLANVRMTLNLLDHIERGRLVLASSGLVYGPSRDVRREDSPVGPTGPYGLSKLLCEACCFGHGHRLEIRIARGFNHIGPGMPPQLVVPMLLRFLHTLPPGAPLELRSNTVRDFVDVRDVVAAYLALAEVDAPSPSVFNVCTGRGRSIDELARLLMARLDQRRDVVFAEKLRTLDDADYLVGSPAKLESTTGWTPRFTLQQSIDTLLTS